MENVVDKIIDGILVAEGGYVNDKDDAGGETMYGITVTTAKANGYYGAMKDLPRATAIQIYKNKYWFEPKFDKVAVLSPEVAAELCDTGVNCGVSFAEGVLQSALNLLNRQEADYKDVPEDKVIGNATLSALGAYLLKRGKEGELVLLRMLNVMQGSRYIELAKTKPSQEGFIYGWFLNRVKVKGD
jgi:lysozyme family protein